MLTEDNIDTTTKVYTVLYHLMLWVVIIWAIVQVNAIGAGFIPQAYMTYMWAAACIWVLGDGILVAVDLNAAERRIGELTEQLAVQANTNSLILQKLDESYILKMENRAMLTMLQNSFNTKNRNNNRNSIVLDSSSSLSPQRNSNDDENCEEEEEEENIEVEPLMMTQTIKNSSRPSAQQQALIRHSKSTSDVTIPNNNRKPTITIPLKRRSSCCIPLDLRQDLSP